VDIVFIAALIALFGLVAALAVGCARLGEKS